jgi:NitT/TauT family transport system permease protein
MKALLLRNARSLALGLSTIVLFLLAWEVAVRVLQVRPLLLPPPGAILAELWSERAWYLDHAWYTLLTTMAGFALSVVVGVLVAVLLVAFKWVDEAVYPLIVALNSVPKVAIAPLFVIWMGTGVEPKVSISFLIAVFAILVDTVHGLRSIPQDVLDLGRVLKGSAFDFFWKVRLPGALPSILTGMKVAMSLALVGTIVGEFVASQRGLGYVILSAQGTFDTTRVFSAIVLLAVMGIVLYGLVAALEWRVSRWRHSE